MKKLLLTVLLLISPLAAQTAHNWGERFTLGKVFKNTDSLALSTNQLDSLTNDTLYTAALDITADYDGVYWPTWFFASNTGTPTDIKVEMRLIFGTPQDSEPDLHYDPWRVLYPACKTDTTYRKSIATADSSWWGPASYLQYRIYMATPGSNVVDPRGSHFIK